MARTEGFYVSENTATVLEDGANLQLEVYNSSGVLQDTWPLSILSGRFVIDVPQSRTGSLWPDRCQIKIVATAASGLRAEKFVKNTAGGINFVRVNSIPDYALTPSSGATVTGTSVVTTWTGTATRFRLKVFIARQADGAGGFTYDNEDQLYGSGWVTGNTATVTGLPANGQPVYRSFEIDNDGVITTLHSVITSAAAGTTPYIINFLGTTFIDPTTGTTRAQHSYSITDNAGNPVSVNCTTEWWLTSTPGTVYDHVAAAPSAEHNQKTPAAAATTSNNPTTLGPYLTAGATYSGRVIITDPITAYTLTQNIPNFTAPTSIIITPPVTSTVWDFDQFQPPPLGLNWTLIGESDEGNVETGHPRITRGQAKDGLPCYRHRVLNNQVVDNLSSESMVPYEVDYADYDRMLLRVHLWAQNYSGLKGKHVAMMTGYGFGGDMIQNSNFYYNPQITYAASFDSRDAGVANIMHPDRTVGGVKQNWVRLLATFAANTPAGLKNQPALNTPYPSLNHAYYGDTFGQVNTVYPLGQWVTFDVIVHRTQGYELYMDGNRVSYATGAPFDVWDEIHCLWWWCRHMHGGTSTAPDMLAIRNYDEFWGGFFIAAN